MTKKIWKLLCILTVFLAGMLIYAGGILFFRFEARREGVYAVIAGGSAAIFFWWLLYGLERSKKRDIADTEIYL